MIKFLSVIVLSCLLFVGYETWQSYLLVTDIKLSDCGSALPSNSIPVTLASAVIAQEDQGFLAHGGVSFGDLKRAIFGNLYHGKAKFGASTIDMQVASICFIKPFALTKGEKLNKWREKLREVIIVKFLLSLYSKQEVLGAYLAAAPLGGNKKGFIEAAEFYYDKSLAELSFNEEWRLVITLRNNQELNPKVETLPKGIRKDWLRAKLRQNQVIQKDKEALLKISFIANKSF